MLEMLNGILEDISEESSDSTAATEKHKARVAELLSVAIEELEKRAEEHDQSKLESPEKEAFDKVTPKLKDLEYGSEEYKKSLKSIDPAIKHHYSLNRHHPEHFAEGISGMSLVDLLEMLADWKASTERYETSSLFKSFQINKERFNIDSQLLSVLRNTVKDLGWE
jgi:hypothetical protein